MSFGDNRGVIEQGTQHTKRLLAALADSVRQFEAKHGVIDVSGPAAPPVQILN
jgi:hypothetical protein